MVIGFGGRGRCRSATAAGRSRRRVRAPVPQESRGRRRTLLFVRGHVRFPAPSRPAPAAPPRCAILPGQRWRVLTRRRMIVGSWAWGNHPLRGDDRPWTSLHRPSWGSGEVRRVPEALRPLIIIGSGAGVAEPSRTRLPPPGRRILLLERGNARLPLRSSDTNQLVPEHRRREPPP